MIWPIAPPMATMMRAMNTAAVEAAETRSIWPPKLNGTDTAPEITAATNMAST